MVFKWASPISFFVALDTCWLGAVWIFSALFLHQKAVHCGSGDDKETSSVISQASEHRPVSSSGGRLLKHGMKSENHREEGSASQQWQELSCACYCHLRPKSSSPAASSDKLCWEKLLYPNGKNTSSHCGRKIKNWDLRFFPCTLV